jgi:hypothetical protein
MSRFNRPLSQCQIDAYNSAHKQNTFYDAKNNQMLYGRSNQMHATGVSDGTCNQINPLMLRHQARCGAGAAGGNPCYPNTVEPFENESNASQGCNINTFVTMLFLILILLLFVNINYYEKNNKSE